MVEPQLVSGLVELPGVSPHHKVKFPWHEAPSKPQGPEKVSVPQKIKDGSAPRNRFSEAGLSKTFQNSLAEGASTKQTFPQQELPTEEELPAHPATKVGGKTRRIKSALLRCVGSLQNKNSIDSKETLSAETSLLDFPVDDRKRFSSPPPPLTPKEDKRKSQKIGALEQTPPEEKSAKNQRRFSKRDTYPSKTISAEAAIETQTTEDPSLKQKSRKSSQTRGPSLGNRLHTSSKGGLESLEEDGFPYRSPPALQSCNHSKRSLGCEVDSIGTSSSKISERYLVKVPNDVPRSKLTKINHHASENLLATLKRINTTFLVDDSASMDFDGNWEAAQKVLGTLVVTLSKYAADGVEISFLHSTRSLRNAKNAAAVIERMKAVRPTGESTPIEAKVELILNRYLEELEYEKLNNKALLKPLNLIILTDGVTDDIDSLISIIGNVTSRLDAGYFPLNQIGIQFIQIGAKRRVTRMLKILDDQLQTGYGISRDIVDMTRFLGEITESFVLKCLLGGINRTIDRM